MNLEELIKQQEQDMEMDLNLKPMKPIKEKVYTVSVNCNMEVTVGGRIFKHNELIIAKSYNPGSGNSILDCITSVCNKIQEFRQSTEECEGASGSYTFTFTRPDGTCIDEITVSYETDLPKIVNTFSII